MVQLGIEAQDMEQVALMLLLQLYSACMRRVRLLFLESGAEEIQEYFQGSDQFEYLIHWELNPCERLRDQRVRDLVVRRGGSDSVDHDVVIRRN